MNTGPTYADCLEACPSADQKCIEQCMGGRRDHGSGPFGELRTVFVVGLILIIATIVVKHSHRLK